MSKSKSLLVGIGIIIAMIIGFFIGISVDYPRINNRSVSGTIGKVNNYRNTQVSEADIQLKNELATDTAKLKMLQGYFNFYYVSALKMNADVELAVKEAKAIESFQAKNKSLTTSLENYGKFLLQARTDLLISLAVCKSVKEADPILLRNTLNQGRNVVAQINYRDRIVLDFVDVLSTFIKANKPGQYPGLEKSHDLLITNEIYTAMITKNKSVMNFLDKTALFCKSQERLDIFDQQKLNAMIQQDLEKLGRFKMNDAEKLNSLDAERLMTTDAEKLKGGDAERLMTLDAEKLKVGDAERLSAGDAAKLSKAFFQDSEKLRCDVEKLGGFDMEKLSGNGGKGGVGGGDAEILGSGKYGNFTFDAEKLGFDDREMLGYLISP
ncbi:MAG: hypothetical protein WCI31_17215 [Prolixibacteraceae bacterium]